MGFIRERRSSTIMGAKWWDTDSNGEAGTPPEEMSFKFFLGF
jgi:hypothetical protein